ncbi:hypothetical protein ACOJBM_00570 [Rhizobium beringeri]
MTLLFAVVGLGEQPAHQLDEHHHRIVGELLSELDDLRHDRCAPTTGIKVGGKPGRDGVSLANHLLPPSRRNSSLQARINLKCAQESNPLGQSGKVPRRGGLGGRAQPMKASLTDRRVDYQKIVQCLQLFRIKVRDQRRLGTTAGNRAGRQSHALNNVHAW